MKLVQFLLALVAITGIAAGLVIAGNPQKSKTAVAACCAVESCCETAECCEPGKCCDSEDGCKSKSCSDCGKTTASCHGTTSAAKPAVRSCCSK